MTPRAETERPQGDMDKDDFMLVVALMLLMFVAGVAFGSLLWA